MIIEKPGRIVKILNRKEVVIDLGKDDGLIEGDKIEVYEIGPEVFGLSGNLIGTLDKVKANLEVITCYQDMSVCSDIKYEKMITGIAAAAETLNVVSGALNSRTVRVVSDLKIDESLIDKGLQSNVEKLRSKDNSILVGDYVRLI